MTDDFSDLNGIGPTLNDRLHENGYDTYEDLTTADIDDLTDIKSLTEDTALSAIAQAEDEVAASGEDDTGDDEPDTTDPETINPEPIATSDDEAEVDAEEAVDDLPDEEEFEGEDDGPDTYTIDLDLSDREREITTSALLHSYTTLRSRNRSRADAANEVLRKLRDGDTVEVTSEQLNALYSALHERREYYKGNNHIELMHTAGDVEEIVNEYRRDLLF